MPVGSTRAEFVTNKSLEKPIPPDYLDLNGTRASSRLAAFEFWSGDRLMEDHGPDHLFDCPIVWLSVVIVRSPCPDYELLFEFIESMGLLGGINERDASSMAALFGTTVEHDPLVLEKRGHSRCGFWLPSGIPEEKVNEVMDASVEDFRQVEKLFQERYNMENGRF